MTRGFSPLANSAFSMVFRRWMNTRFDRVHIFPPAAPVPRNIPLMVVANHVSWWDGFLLIELQRRMRPGVPFHTVMLEKELRAHPFLERLGAIGLNTESPGSILQSIHELERRIKAQPDSMIFFFPQGKIRPSWRRPLEFKRGIEVFCKGLGSLLVMPVAIHIEPLNTASPHAFVSAADPIVSDAGLSSTMIEARVEDELDRLLGLIGEQGEAAAKL